MTNAHDRTNVSGHIAGSYRGLRVALFSVGVSLPLILIIGGYFAADIPLATHSMSAYYHLSAKPEVGADGTFVYTHIPANLGTMRDWFVGGLGIVGILLVAYKGIRPLEDWILNIAGLMAWGVALFPMDWPIASPSATATSAPEAGGSSMSLHGLCAVVLFLCIAYVCIFRASDTLTPDLIPDEKKRKAYLFTYRVLGVLMAASPLLAWLFTRGSSNHLTFFIEAFGVWVFAIYWFVKGRELRESMFEDKAMRGQFLFPQKATLLGQSPVQKCG